MPHIIPIYFTNRASRPALKWLNFLEGFNPNVLMFKFAIIIQAFVPG
jgi:hypothetical protein